MADLTPAQMSRNDAQARIAAALNGQAVIAGTMHSVLKDLAQRISAFAASPQDNALSPALRTLHLAAEFTGYWGVGSMFDALHRLAYGIEITPVLSIKREEYLDRVRTLAAGLSALGTHLGEVAAGQVSSYTPLQEHFVRLQRKIKPKLLELSPEHLEMVSFMPVAPSIEVDAYWEPDPDSSHEALVVALSSLAPAITQERLERVVLANPYSSLSGFFEAAAAEMAVAKGRPLVLNMGREFERLHKLLKPGRPLVAPAPDPMALSSLMFVVAHSDSDHSSVQALCRRYKLTRRRGAGQRAISMTDVARKFADAMVKAGEAYGQCASTRTPAPVEVMAEQLLRESGVLGSSAVSALASALHRHSAGWKSNPELEFESWTFGAALVLLLQEATADWGQEQAREELAAVADVMAATGQIVPCETFTRKTRAAAIRSACVELLTEAGQLKIGIEGSLRSVGEDTLSDGQANAIQQGAGFRLAGLLAVVAGLCDCLSLPWGAAFARELRRRTQSLETWVAPGSRAELFDGFLRVMAFVGRLRPNSLIDIQDDELGRFTHVLEVSVQPPVQDLQMAVADFGLDPYLALAVATPPAQAVLAADRGESEMAKVVPTLLQASPEVLDAGGGTSRSDADAQGQAFAEDAAQVLEVVVAVGGESELATRSDDQWGREPFDARPVAAAVSDPQYEFVEEAPPDIVAQAEVAAQATECEGEPPPADRPAEVPATTPAVPESCLMGTGEPAEMVDGDGTPNVDSAKRQEPHAELPPQPDGLAAELAPAIGPEAVGSGESSEESDAARMKAEPSTGLADLGELGALMGGLLGTAAPAATQPRDSGKPAMDVATLLAPARGQPNKLDFVDSELLSIMFEEATGFLDSIDAMLALWRIGGVASEQLRGTVGEIRRVVHSLKGVIRTCGLASAGAVLHAMEDRLEITADDGLDLASDVPAYLDAMAAVRATIELGREQFESGVAGPLPETGGQVVSCDLGPVPAVQALPVPDDVLPLVPHDVVTAVPDDVAVTVEPFGDLDAVLSMPLAGLQTVVVSPDAEEPALPRAAEQSEPADQAGADTWQASAEVVGSCDEGVLLNGLLVDEARVTPAERIAAQPQPVAEVPLASDGAAMRPVALAPAALQPEADSPELASECGFAAAQLVVFPGSQEPPVAVDPSGESDADAMSSPAAGAEDGGYLAVTAAAGEPLPPTCEPAPELLPALVAVPAPEPEAILPVTAAVPSAAAALAAVVAPLAAQYPAGPSAPAALPKGDGSVRIPLRLANRVGDASGQLQAAGRRAQEELDRAARQMRELQENLVRMGGVIRELDILAAASLPASSVLPAVQGFDPLEMDRYGALQEQVRRLLEAFDDTQASAQGLAEDLRRTQGTEEERAEVSEDLQRDASELTLVDVGMQRVRLERTVAKACSDAHRLARLVIEPGCRVPGAALDKLMWVFEHLLRNAVAHGIEPSDARETAGKPAAGTITIGAPRASANADGSVLRIAVRDDGRGIDHDRVLSIAVSRGLALRGMAYTREQIRNFLFMPGFSTASAVSELAGRGVGLDVVRAALATLGGMVAIDSEDGQGAEFVLTLPTDSASMAVIPVSASGYRCLLPLSLVTRVVSLSSGEDVAIDVSGGRARVANSEYPMITLASRVPAHDGTQARQGRGHLVLMSESQSVTGVLVDTVGQQSRVVVRQLGPIVRDVPGMVAGTALPDGQVGLVVNPLRLQAIERQQMAISAADTARTPHVLVVDDSATVRLVTSRFLKRLGYQTTAARDGVEALQMIDNGLAPDGILLDLEMPGIDGFELLAQLRSLPRFSTVPMVVISSRVGAKYGDRARELGATAYLAKPYEDATLQRLLSKLFVKCADSHVPI